MKKKFSGVSEFNQAMKKKILRCIGVQEEKASVAADEMAVKRQLADTNFLEKKIGC